MNLLIIHTIVEKKGISIPQLADEIKMSKNNLYRCIKLNKIEASVLEKIAKYLDVSVSIFFDEVQNNVQLQNDSNNNIANADQQKLINSLEQTIKAQSKTIDLLTKELERKRTIGNPTTTNK